MPSEARPPAIPPATANTRRLPARPPAIWAAFARQGAFKNWMLVLQFALNFTLATAAVGFSRKQPDVVLIDPEGKSTYINRSIAGDALVRFLAEQRQQPSDVTVAHFTRTFLQTFLAINSTIIDHAWSEALSMMDAPLRDRISREATAQKLLETYRLARVQTDITVDELTLVERHSDVLHVRAVVTRRKQSLDGAKKTTKDRIQVDLIERVVPRTPFTADGLQSSEYRNTLLSD